MSEKISIIVPVYNVEKYLRRCVDSVLCQTYENIEVILVDDGATDSSSAICDEYLEKDKRVRVVHKQNGGLSSARNAGLDIATGDYIGFIDSDDFISPTMYETLLDISLNHKNSISGINALIFPEGEELPEYDTTKEMHKVDSYEYVKGLLLRVSNCSVCSKLFPREVCQNKRFEEGRTNEDGLFLFYLFLKEKLDFVYSDEIHYYYMTRKGSICNQKFSSALPSMYKNFLEMEDYIKKYELPMQQEANDAVIYACEMYLLNVPISFIEEKETLTVEVITQLKKRKNRIRNTKLRTKDKLFLYLFLFNHKLARKIKSLI